VERDSLRGTFKAFETGDAILLPVFLWTRFMDCAHRALLHTLLAVGAIFCDKTPQYSETRNDGEEGPQRTEVAAPESLFHHPQGKDHDEKEKDQKIHLKHRHWNGRRDKRILRKKALNLGNEGIKDKDSRRIKSNHKGPGDKTDRVKDVHHLKGHHACHKRKDKNSVPEPSERLIIGLLRPFSLPEENPVEKIDGRPHRAKPSTKEIAKNKNGEEHSEGRKHSQDDLFLREDRDDPDERIESKVEVYRDLQLKGKSRLNDEIEKEEEGKGLNRPS
jgi:hypothetical protein